MTKSGLAFTGASTGIWHSRVRGLLIASLWVTIAAQPARTSTLPDFTGRAAEVAAAFEQYARLLRAIDHAGMAALFVPTGRVVNPGETPIVGPAAIDAFLERFADY